TAENNFDLIPSTIGDTLRRAQGVHDVVGVRSGEARFLNGKHQFTAVDPGGSHIFRLDWTQGSQAVLDRLGPNGAFTDKDYAKKHHLSVGSTVSVLVPSGQRRTFTIKFVFLDASGGVNPANDVKLDRILQGFPNAKVQDREEFKRNQASFLGNILNILYVLLALSVIVSLFGIVNTLVLTIFERTRELGMLRAVGMTRWQVRWMIGLESVVTALIGAVIGISLGIVL